jgi:predicted lactoylglutathione lyase
MAQPASRKIFVNLPVRELRRSMEFFSRLGFHYNPQFTDDKAACMVLSEDGYVMLLQEPFFRTFTKNEICDTSRSTETLLALSCGSREEVDQMVETAVAAGGRKAMPSQDQGFMYSWSFYDPDGHHWELVWMDPQHVEAQP